MSTKYKVFKTRSGLKYALDENLYSSIIGNDESGETLDLFETFLLAGEYSPSSSISPKSTHTERTFVYLECIDV